nr:MAG TPA: Recombination enhancement, RecA-dependent nuclease [Caudoviricetes sp.]DAZ39268.1 MAG TPA: Recombination enhancement, RecA-dependent nuclease [Caudoviricetes sp.]
MYGKCWLCGKVGAVERHHIFGGSNRDKSERDGLVVLLCGDTCHRNGPRAAHQCAETALELKKYGERKWMYEHEASTDDFRREYGKNYL